MFYIFMVADLLDSLILSWTETKNNIFLSKFSPQIKLSQYWKYTFSPPLLKAFALYDKWPMRNEKWEITIEKRTNNHSSK